MPLYEYICHHCQGVFEELRSIRESSEPAPCPQCDRDCARIMPTSFNARSMRDGLARQLPDRGTYWHLGKEVKHANTGGVPAFQHPELYRPAPPREPSIGEKADIAEMERLEQRHAAMLEDSGLTPSVGKDGKRNLSPALAADGHVSARDIRNTEKAREGKRK